MLAGGVVLALAGCGGPGPVGAAAPAGAGTPAMGTQAGDTAAQSPGATGRPSDGPTATAPSDSPAAAAGVVVSYFTEINAASRAGRVADVSALALPGCQACALDIGVTRDLQQRVLHAAADPYTISAVTAGTRAGLAITVTFTAATSAVGLLDPAGRQVAELAGVPTRTGDAQLTLAGSDWLIQTIRYAARQR
jgi:hypothetical protein